MTTKHAHYGFSYTGPSSDKMPVIHRYTLDFPGDIPTLYSVAKAFLDFLGEVHGYPITVDMPAEKAAAV